MEGNISDAISAFSQKFKRFNQSGQKERTVLPSENQRVAEQIREREQRLKAGVVQTYRIYKAPLEALGKNSDRALGLERDESALLDAYNLYKGVMDVNSGAGEGGSSVEEGAAPGEKTTFISKIELTSPLAQKAVYTSGGQFIYLLCWLYFEKNCQEYMPLFTEKNNFWSLTFVKSENFEFDSHDKEIFEIVRQEFYS